MADGRAKNGGRRPNSGRKSKAEEMGLAALLNEVFTEQARREVLQKLVEDSKSPQPKLRHQARELLLAYTYGKPVQRQEIDAKVDSYLVDIGTEDENS